MPRGGVRPGSGRKSKAEELQIRNIAIEAITEKHGSLKGGLIALLNTGDAPLVKFVYEHAYGKPTEKVQHSGDEHNPIVNKHVVEFRDMTNGDNPDI